MLRVKDLKQVKRKIIMTNKEKNHAYDDCVLEIRSCFSEDDYEEILDMIQELYSEDEITGDEYDKLKDMHHDANFLFSKGVDDYDWENMKMFNPNLSDQ